MAWITPVTNRNGPDTRTTETDMNRIAGNLNYLTGGSFKDDYTNTDIVLKTDWTTLIDAVRFFNSDVTTETSWNNLNLIESTMLSAYNGGVVPKTNLYPSNSLIPLSE